jgi:hypothetical protein
VATAKEPFDPDELDPEDPFEIDDGNRPHLFKHGPYEVDDLYDGYLYGDPLFLRAESGEADWLMVALIPGDVIVAPLAKPKSGQPNKCRPIGIYQASRSEKSEYFRSE